MKSKSLRATVGSSHRKPKQKAVKVSFNKTSLEKDADSIPKEIIEIREQFAQPEALLHKLLSLTDYQLDSLTKILSHLQGKELTSILKALNKPCSDGKKKSRQVLALIEALKECPNAIKRPDLVRYICISCVLSLHEQHSGTFIYGICLADVQINVLVLKK